MFWNDSKRIYLDYAATTPLDTAVFRVMSNVYKNNYYNPGGLYTEGVSAAAKIVECRKSVAKLLGTTSDHIIFTRGGTESDNLAIMGVIEKYEEENFQGIPHVIVSEIEHSAVLETVIRLEQKGEIELSIIPVDAGGIVNVDEIKKALKPETILVSIMYVNNEIGTIQPIREVAKLIRWYKKQNDLSQYPLLHTDAIQAANYLDINVERLGVDLLSLSGSKIYGPKSAGILYIRSGERITPIIYGGDQEFGLRAGTEDIAQIAGFTKALEIARETSQTESVRLGDLQKYFFAELEKNIPDMKINGSVTERIPNNINISIPEISSERIIIELDAKRIAASSKSACREDEDEESYVIAALRRATSAQATAAEGSVRFTMGRSTTRNDIEKVVKILAEIVGKIKTFQATLKN